MEKKVKLALIASGGGTDANSIMEAWRNNGIPEVSDIILISTKKGAGCLEKAKHHEVPAMVMDYSDYEDVMSYNLAMRDLLLQQYDVDLVFLVGCLKKILPLSDYYRIYNIHPAEPARHGGDQMYDLAVHEHILEEIGDLIHRGRASVNDKFFSYPTILEVDKEYDSGKILLQLTVEIPPKIIRDYVGGNKDPKKVVEELQKYILPYEWLMLPLAVRIEREELWKGG